MPKLTLLKVGNRFVNPHMIQGVVDYRREKYGNKEVQVHFVDTRTDFTGPEADALMTYLEERCIDVVALAEDAKAKAAPDADADAALHVLYRADTGEVDMEERSLMALKTVAESNHQLKIFGSPWRWVPLDAEGGIVLYPEEEAASAIDPYSGEAMEVVV